MATMTIEVDSFDFGAPSGVVVSELIEDVHCYSSYKITVDPSQAAGSSVWLTWYDEVGKYTTFSVLELDSNGSTVGGFLNSGIEVSTITEFKVSLNSARGSFINKPNALLSIPLSFMIFFQAYFSEGSSILQGSTKVIRKGYFHCNLFE
jgi:hypothetical protein